jgi:protein ImuA
MNSLPPFEPRLDLSQLLRREDIWQGKERQLVIREGLDTGYGELNQALNAKGWPLGQLVEVCLTGAMQGEWLLLQQALVRQVKGLIVFLNPPLLPFAQALIQSGVDLDKLLIVQAEKKADFLSSFVEITRSGDCGALIAWQPNNPLSYTDLRKCLLAAQEGQGFYVMCRPMSVKGQSSPAALRLAVQLHEKDFSVSIFKQKGQLKPQTKAIHLPIPEFWKGLAPHYELDKRDKPKRKSARIIRLQDVKPGR